MLKHDEGAAESLQDSRGLYLHKKCYFFVTFNSSD